SFPYTTLFRSTISIIIAHGNSHAGLGKAILIESDSAFYACFAKGAIAIVMVKQTGSGITSHVEVRPAPVLKVAPNGRQPIAVAGRLNPCFQGNLGKCAVAIVMIEMIFGSRQTTRATKDRYALPPAMGGGARERRLGQVHVHVTRQDTRQHADIAI